jgi:hypothetical protein
MRGGSPGCAFLLIIAEAVRVAARILDGGMDRGTADPCGMTTKKRRQEQRRNGNSKEGDSFCCRPLCADRFL